MTASRPDDAAAALACRKLLATTPAPATPLACLSTLSTLLKVGTNLTLAYVPDRRLVSREDFQAYAAARSRIANASAEALAVAIAEDVANEVVPKWLRVTITTGGPATHTVVVEDRQPGWDHPTLLKDI